MNLRVHLLSRIILVAVICLAATSTFILYRSDVQARHITQEVAQSLGQQLELQLLRMNAGFGEAQHFPDFALWRQTGGTPGICIRYNSAESSTFYSLCNGTKRSIDHWPAGFETVYRRLFSPGSELTRSITYNGRIYGFLTISPSADMNIAKAWDDVLSLTGLSAITVLAVCILVAVTISRALQPAGVIVNGLERIEHGDLAYRLPQFELCEWQRISIAINRLTTTQRQLLLERQKLAVKLMTLQEEERRVLSRELHDEFGQCLTAISAVSTSIAQSAGQQHSPLAEEAEYIHRISYHMMASLRGLLRRLRPVDLDELRLSDGLNALIAEWNQHCSGQTRFKLNFAGDCSQLSKPLAVALFRITQECLTNIAKHAAATEASVSVAIHADAVSLTVQDNGIVTKLPFVDSPGIGLIGIRERVDALHGHLALAIAIPHGLIVNVVLPIQSIANAQT